jgi:uncharacterized protein YoxC
VLLTALSALQLSVSQIAGTQAEQQELLQAQGKALRDVQEVAAEVRASRDSQSEVSSVRTLSSDAGSAPRSVKAKVLSVQKKTRSARVVSTGEGNVLRLFKSQGPFPGAKVKAEPAAVPADVGAPAPAPAAAGDEPAAASKAPAKEKRSARQRKRDRKAERAAANARARAKKKAELKEKVDSSTDDSVYADSAGDDPGEEAGVGVEADRPGDVPYFSEGNDRPARLTNNIGVSLFEPLREAEWFNLFGEGNWKKLGVGAVRELEVTYTVEARLLDIELAIGLGVRAENLLPTLAATRQFLQERLDGCLDVLEAGGDARAIKVARVMQEIIREKRQRRKHRSDTHAALFAQADKALSKTTTRRIADMLHWQRFGSAPWTKDGQAPGGGGGGGAERPRTRAPKGRKAPWVAGGGAGRAAYERDRKAGKPWIGRKNPAAAVPPTGAGGEG